MALSWDETHGRGRRPRIIPEDFKQKGMGLFEPADTFPAHLRPHLARQIEKAYNIGLLGHRESKRFLLAWRLGLALNDKGRSMIGALRHHMELDGDELTTVIRSLVPVIPALGEPGSGDLASWVEKEIKGR